MFISFQDSLLYFFQFLSAVDLTKCPGANEAEKITCLENAFEAGSGVNAATLASAISAIVITMIIIWAAWVIISQYQSFSKGEITFYDMIWRVIRAVFVLLLFTIFIVPNNP